METCELIRKVKDNDYLACEEMINNYRQMIFSIINEYDLEYGDFKISSDDLYQEGLIGIYDACRAYEEGKDVKFSTFAYLVIKRRVNRCYRNQLKNYVNECCSIDCIENKDKRKEFEVNTVSDNILTYRQESLEKKIRHLDDFDRQIVMLRLEDMSYLEIAKKLDVSKKRIDNRLYKLRKKFTKYNGLENIST